MKSRVRNAVSNKLRYGFVGMVFLFVQLRNLEGHTPLQI
jgi:hypothetical protein